MSQQSFLKSREQPHREALVCFLLYFCEDDGGGVFLSMSTTERLSVPSLFSLAPCLPEHKAVVHQCPTAISAGDVLCSEAGRSTTLSPQIA